MTSFCHGKFAVQTKKEGVNVVKDAERRILEAHIKSTVREYYNANGNKDAKMLDLLELSEEFLAKGGTNEELEIIINGK